MRNIILTLFLFASNLFAFAVEPGMIVTQKGESLKVYNLDITSGDYVYYTLSESQDAQLQKLKKTDILIIKKTDGTKIDPNTAKIAISKSPYYPEEHTPITCDAISKITIDKKGDQIVSIKDSNGELLYLRIVPNEDKILAVTKWQGKGKYKGEKYVIPEYVNIEDKIYTIKYIDEKAFGYPTKWGIDNFTIKEIIFPKTLTKIGAWSCCFLNSLSKIILPDGIEEIGDGAFYKSGSFAEKFEQLHIPETVKRIGTEAFMHVGRIRSLRGFYQGYISSIPEYININTCKSYGIDEEAVENYERKIGIRK